MIEATPQKLPRKPGEPGGEKARVAKELFDSLSDHAPIPTVLLTQEQFTRAVAGALAACALEAEGRALKALTEQDCAEAYQNAPNWRGVRSSLVIRIARALGRVAEGK